MKVGDIMTREVVTAGPDTGVDAIARMMLEHHVGAVPIVDSEGRLMGILSDHDLLRHPPKNSPRAGWLRLFDQSTVCLEDLLHALVKPHEPLNGAPLKTPGDRAFLCPQPVVPAPIQ